MKSGSPQPLPAPPAPSPAALPPGPQVGYGEPPSFGMQRTGLSADVRDVDAGPLG